MNIEWKGPGSYLFLNPTYSLGEQERLNRILEAAVDYPGHVWLATSGSSSQKWVGLSKAALLSSAEAVNQHLMSDRNDRWVNALPCFHVGGLGIWARAHLSGAEVCDFNLETAVQDNKVMQDFELESLSMGVDHSQKVKATPIESDYSSKNCVNLLSSTAVSRFKESHPGKWNAEEFYHYLKEVKGTLSALVPAQLHDLVKKELKSPSSLRALVIGGGALLPEIYEKAVHLGWPVLPSYGLTECASQVATAPLEECGSLRFPLLQLLSHLHASVQDGRLVFSGSSLLSVYALIEDDNIRFHDPKKEGWFFSQDKGVIHERRLQILGRIDDLIKIGGESVDLSRLESLLQKLSLQMKIDAEWALIAMPDSRLGHSIHFAANSNNLGLVEPLIARFQEEVLPFERIRKVHYLEQLPRSPLGKILKNRLIEMIMEKKI
jgi:O-succinylbenzoic acid--CoA ligase